MPAKFENKLQRIDSRIWVGKYHTLHNLPHWHLAPELIACQSGSATVVVEGHSLCITAGEVAVCHGGSIHFINTEQNGLLLVAQVDPALVESIVGQRRLNDLVFKDKFGTTDRLDAIFAEMYELTTEERTETRTRTVQNEETGEDEEEEQGCAEGEGKVCSPKAKTPLYL